MKLLLTVTDSLVSGEWCCCSRYGGIPEAVARNGKLAMAVSVVLVHNCNPIPNTGTRYRYPRTGIHYHYRAQYRYDYRYKYALLIARNMCRRESYSMPTFWLFFDLQQQPLADGLQYDGLLSTIFCPSVPLSVSSALVKRQPTQCLNQAVV